MPCLLAASLTFFSSFSVSFSLLYISIFSSISLSCSAFISWFCFLMILTSYWLFTLGFHVWQNRSIPLFAFICLYISSVNFSHYQWNHSSQFSHSWPFSLSSHHPSAMLQVSSAFCSFSVQLSQFFIQFSFKVTLPTCFFFLLLFLCNLFLLLVCHLLVSPFPLRYYHNDQCTR